MKNRIFAAFVVICFLLCSFNLNYSSVAAEQMSEYFYESFDKYTDADIGAAWITANGTVSKDVQGAQNGALRLTSDTGSDATVSKAFSKTITDTSYEIEFFLKMNCGFDVGITTSDGETLNIAGFRTDYGKIGIYKTGSGRMSFAANGADTSLKYASDTWNRIRIEVNKADKTYTVKAPYGEFSASYTANIGDASGIHFTAVGQSDAESVLVLDEISIHQKRSASDIATIYGMDGKLVCENSAAVTGDIAINTDGAIVFNCGTEVREDGKLTYDVDLRKGTMHIDIDQAVPDSGEERSEIALEITYDDLLYPWLHVKYAAKDGMKLAGYLSGKNTRQEVTQTFILSDADFNNSSCPYDLTLVSYDGFTENQAGLANRRSHSQDWVYIKRIRIYKTDKKAPYSADIKTDNVGNIFYDSETPKFDITYNLLASRSVDLTAEYAVYEYDDNSERELLYIRDTKEKISDKYTQTAVLPVSKYGLYEFEIRLKDGDGNIYQSMSVPFSRCVKNDTLNYSFGSAGHLTRYGDAEAEIELLKNAGLGLFRDDFGWIEYERIKGVYQLGSRPKRLLELTKENNIKLLPILTGNNINYNPDIVENSYSFVENNTEAFAAFMRKIVQEDLFSHVEMVEIWNEPDLLNYIEGRETDNLEEKARAYANDLKYAYDAIKSVRPDIEVGAFSLSGGLHDSYRRGFADYVLDEIGQDKAFDSMTMHPYMSGEDPEVGTFGTDNSDMNSSMAYRINYYRDLMNGKAQGSVTGNTYNQNNQAPMWHTEFGWSTANHSDELARKSESEQASLIIRSYDAIKQNNFDDKAWVYVLADPGTRIYEKEDCYGIVHSHNSKVPYSAKYAYLAISNYNRLTAGVQGVSHEEISPYVFRSKYNCGERDVFMVWTSGEDKTVEMDFSEAASYYDFYGNKLSRSEIAEGEGFRVTTKPFYVVEGEKIDTKYEVSAYFSSNGIIMAEPKLSDIAASDFDITIDFKNKAADPGYIAIAALYNNGCLLDVVMISNESGRAHDAVCEFKNNSFKNYAQGYDEIRLMIFKDRKTLLPIGKCIKVK